MLKIKTLFLSAVLACGTALAAQATTLASFDITGGTYEVVGGEQIRLHGLFSGDATRLLAADPFVPLPLVFGATIGVNGTTVFSGDTSGFGPIVASPLDLLFGAALILGDLDDLTGGALGDAFDYMAAGLGRTDLTDVFDLGIANLFFSYTGGITGPGTLSGTFTGKIIQTDTSGGTLSQIINAGLADLDLLGALSPRGFVFPSNDEGTFEASLTIAAVPLPAGLPLLGAGLLGLVWLRRRKTV